MTRTSSQHHFNQAALDARKPRAGPLLDPEDAIAAALTTADWQPGHFHPANSPVVKAVMDALRMAGYAVVVATREEMRE